MLASIIGCADKQSNAHLPLTSRRSRAQNPHNLQGLFAATLLAISIIIANFKSAVRAVQVSIYVRIQPSASQLEISVRKLHMTASSREIDRVMLEAVSEDYQSFEAVVSKLSQFAEFLVTDIERILLDSIAKNLVAAYLLHADPPYATEVSASSETIRRYWFCITDEGRQYLSQLIEQQAVARRHGSQ